MWMWFKEFNRFFCKDENFANREINEQSFSTAQNEKEMFETIESSPTNFHN